MHRQKSIIKVLCIALVVIIAGAYGIELDKRLSDRSKLRIFEIPETESS